MTNIGLERKRTLLTKELVELHYFYMHQMHKENKIKRLQTYGDWLYGIHGNCLNPSLVDSCRILKQHIEAFSLKNKRLIKRADILYSKALEIKTELYKLVPNKRGVALNKDWAKMFAGKHRKIFDLKFKK